MGSWFVASALVSQTRDGHSRLSHVFVCLNLGSPTADYQPHTGAEERPALLPAGAESQCFMSVAYKQNCPPQIVTC